MNIPFLLHKTIGILSKSHTLEENIREFVPSSFTNSCSLILQSDPGKAIEFLNYELPDLIIVDLTSPIDKLEKIRYLLKNDPWLTNIGIICLIDKNSNYQYVQESSRWNLVCLLDIRDSENIKRVLNLVLNQGHSLLTTTPSLNDFKEHAKGTISIGNSISEAEKLANQIATFLLQSNKIDINKFYNLNMGLSELLINAIEHGNCGISFSDKTKLLEDGINIIEHIEKLSSHKALKDKIITINYEVQPAMSSWTIRDMGDGFDVEKYTNLDPTNLLPHGRGILMAKNSSDQLIYNEKGNEVTLICKHKADTEFIIPQGFKDEEQVFFQEGDIVFEEGQQSAFLYYILYGEFEVYVRGKKVGFLSPADLFMGEMSFLLNNKRNAKVVAKKSGSCIKIPKKSFIRIIKKYPNYLVLLSKLLALRLSRANQENEHVVTV
jgi:anti-sigma regulatory factor (Ser/Thr protein kinase)